MECGLAVDPGLTFKWLKESIKDIYNDSECEEIIVKIEQILTKDKKLLKFNYETKVSDETKFLAKESITSYSC